MKASDNPFSKIRLVEQGAAPADPAAGERYLYFLSDGKLYQRDSDGNEAEVGGGGGGGGGTLIAAASSNAIREVDATGNYPDDSRFLGSWNSAQGSRAFTLMTFDISALAGKTIYHASLLCTHNGASAANSGLWTEVRRMLRAYDPATVTWNNYSTGNAWGTAGGLLLDVDSSAPYASAQTGLRESNTTTTFDVTRLLGDVLRNSETTLRILMGQRSDSNAASYNTTWNFYDWSVNLFGTPPGVDGSNRDQAPRLHIVHN